MPTNAMPTGIEPCCNWNFFMPNSTSFALYILPLNSVTIALSSVFTPISIHVSSLLILYFLYQRNNHKKDYRWSTPNLVQRGEKRQTRRKRRIIVYRRKYAHFYTTNALAGVDHQASP